MSQLMKISLWHCQNVLMSSTNQKLINAACIRPFRNNQPERIDVPTLKRLQIVIYARVKLIDFSRTAYMPVLIKRVKVGKLAKMCTHTYNSRNLKQLCNAFSSRDLAEKNITLKFYQVGCGKKFFLCVCVCVRLIFKKVYATCLVLSQHLSGKYFHNYWCIGKKRKDT